MSDSELSDAPAIDVPSDVALEKALRKEVAKQINDADKSVNSIRKGAAGSLGLSEGYFVDEDGWKARSKAIIKIALENLENAPGPGPAKPKTTKPTTKAAPKKRPSSAAGKPPQKRRKKAPPKDDSGDELSSLPTEDSDIEAEDKAKKAAVKPKKSKPPTKALKQSQAMGKPKPKPKEPKSDSELSDVPTDEAASIQALAKIEDDSGSEMSVLIDEEPQPRKKRKSKDPADKPKAPKAKSTAEDDPDQEEIKRLQGWLVKCGIRKIWAFELKPYESSKAKIKHLKDMLAEVGMTGRYSLEKASNIKEQRELAADIEAVQEGNEIWGKDGEERSRRSKRSDAAVTEDNVDDGDCAPTRKLVRGPKRYDFLSSDGEESD